MPAKKKQSSQPCSLCGKSFPVADLIPVSLVREPIADLIRSENPQWSGEGMLCQEDLSNYRSLYIQKILQAEKGELTELEKEVVESMHKQELLSTNVEEDYQETLSLGDRLADGVAKFGGSWKFIFIFFFFLLIWIIINSLLLWIHPFDPYPFILLNLMLSCLAAIQAPIIMMSQNRQEAKDRMRSLHDYQVNLKAELEIRHLHEKLDHLLSRQWERLMEIQQVQIELLNEKKYP
jgi:uncharacterized membrane protein